MAVGPWTSPDLWITLWVDTEFGPVPHTVLRLVLQKRPCDVRCALLCFLEQTVSDRAMNITQPSAIKRNEVLINGDNMDQHWKHAQWKKAEQKVRDCMTPFTFTTGKSIGTENLVVDGDWGGGGWRKGKTQRYKASFWGDGSVLELDGGDIFTRFSLQLTREQCRFKLHSSTYMWLFFNSKCYSATRPTFGWILRCGGLHINYTWITPHVAQVSTVSWKLQSCVFLKG